MSAPARDLAALRSSSAALLAGLAEERWTDEEVRQPSLLPDWSRAHVLTHIARNADGITRTLSASLRGEVVERYPDGDAGRDADIEAGSGRGSAELLADVTDSAERLDRVLAAVNEAGAWEAPSSGGQPAGHWLRARWREVEIHRVDLGGRYGAADWPPGFVAYLLPETVGEARDRSSAPVTVRTTGGLVLDFAGRTWVDAGPGAVEVAGPDWAVLAWLLGRPEAAAEGLSAAPPISSWR